MTATLWQSCQEEGGTVLEHQRGERGDHCLVWGQSSQALPLSLLGFVGSLWLGSKREVGDHLGP